jgi:phage-related holin
MTDRVFTHICELKASFFSTKVWLILSVLQAFIQQFIFSEWNFAIGFFGIFLIDTWSGVYISWRQKRFSSKILRDKLLDKSVAYFSIIIAYSMATKITLNDSATNLLKFSDLIFYSIITTAEIASIIKNWYTYKQWPIFKKLMTYFDSFDEEGKPKTE